MNKSEPNKDENILYGKMGRIFKPVEADETAGGWH